jgi:hypothetical protein
MLVSNFKIGFCPPLDTPRKAVSTQATRWTRGYALQITNLAPQNITFEVEWRATNAYIGGISEPLAASMDHLVGLHWAKDASGYYALDRYDLPPDGSETWHLQPWMWDDRFWTPYVEGYAILRVPVVPETNHREILVPQSKNPVPVLLNAWHEEIRLQRVADTDLETSAQCDVPLASGKVYNEIIPELHFVFHPPKLSEFVKEEGNVLTAADFRLKRLRGRSKTALGD